MDRGASVSPGPGRTHSQYHPVLPPWEVRTVAQVPFMEPKSPPIPRRDDQPSLNSRTNPNINHRPKLSASTSTPCQSEYSSPVNEHSSSNPWRSDVPLRSGSAFVQPAYETPVYQGLTYDRSAYDDPHHFKPAIRKAISHPPMDYAPHAPPTPPDSVSKASLRSASASPPIRPESKALPGTMSSRAMRNRSASHARTKAGGTERQSDHRQAKQDQTGLGKRFKSAFCDIFKKDPVDDSQFERISDRHWTDEY